MTALSHQTSRRPILVPVDFSSPAKAALMFACRLADKVDTPLLVLHVVHESSSQAGNYRKHDRSGRMLPVDEVAESMVEEFLLQLRKEDPSLESLTRARLLVVSGLPAERIAEVAARENTAMIVMGTDGRSGLSRLFSGSVSQEVAKRTAVPVTIIKAPDTDWENNPVGHRLGSADWWHLPAPTPPTP